MDYYFTISEPKKLEIKVEKSSFIASAFSIKDKDEALELVEKVRIENYNSTHNCFAYRIGYDGLISRFSDDGEPNGSAGKPILFSIKKAELSDILVVVTRYYGGKKLGVGGLVRAYGDVSYSCLEICERKKVDITTTIEVFCTYEDVSIIKKLVDEFAITYSEDYTDSIYFKTEVPISKTHIFTDKITASTSARAGFRLKK